MKTIAELQHDIRIIKKEISGIDKRLDEMSDELANYKSSARDTSEYKHIFEIAKTMPVIQHPMAKTNRVIKNNYMGTIANGCYSN